MSPAVRHSRSARWALALVLLLNTWGCSAAEAQSRIPDNPQVYLVQNVRDVRTRSAIAATGALILEVGHDYVLVEANRQEARDLEKRGFTVLRQADPLFQATVFPPGDSAYHDYGEMVAELQQAAADHPLIFSLFSIGTSDQGRT